MKHIIDDADKNKYEAYSKEEVLEVIQEAISSGELPEEINGLVITLKNPIDNNGYKIAFCTQAKYNELQTGGQLEANCYYYITDDTTMDDINDELNYLRSDYESLDNRVDDVEDDITEINNKINAITPVNIPIDSSNPRSVNIHAYGKGLYLVTIKHSAGVTPTPVFTSLLSIEDFNGEMARNIINYGSGNTFELTGRYYSNLPANSNISIGGFSDSDSNWSIFTLRQLIKY